MGGGNFKIRVTKYEKQAVEEMLRDLENFGLEVIAIPTEPSGKGKRLTVCQNPDWYQDLCAAYPSTRNQTRPWRPRTRMKRCQVIDALKRIQSGDLQPDFEYHRRLMPYITEIAKQIKDAEQDVPF
jgi:hypothetical protein